MALAPQWSKRPVFQIKEFFIMVTGKNEVNLFPGFSLVPHKTQRLTVFLNNGLGSGKYGSGNPIRGTTDVVQT